MWIQWHVRVEIRLDGGVASRTYSLKGRTDREAVRLAKRRAQTESGLVGWSAVDVHRPIDCPGPRKCAMWSF